MKRPQPQENKGLLGFTLIELSIVLVIIGLIVGGVLVGQDLIKAAEVRATVAQYEKYNSAINTFRSKYNGMPGDLNSTQASAFGLYSTGSTSAGYGDGNALIQDQAGTASINAPAGEPVIFWRHLTDASLVDGSYGANLVASTAQLDSSNTQANYFPGTKLGRGTYWLVGSASGLNYYGLTGLTGVTSGASGTATYTQSKGLTPIEAYNIDVKVDDGMPNTGITQARGVLSSTTVDGIFATLATSTVSAWTSASAPAAGDCMTTGGAALSTANTYARGTTPGNTPACNLRMRFN